jgi:hypothetical protein
MNVLRDIELACILVPLVAWAWDRWIGWAWREKR